MALKPVSVSQLNSYIKRVLASDPILMNIGVCGEVSNLTKHSSGHWYFALKDKGSRINCFLPADRVALQRFELSEGMQINAYGSISLYEKGGYYSLNIKSIEAEGEGTLKQAFELLKNKLAAEGLFSTEYKKPIPAEPKNIGIVTSPTGAAVKDIITTVKRRNPFVNILIYPCLVQGENAASSICEGIRFLNEQHPSLDVLIVGRGGGSAEDLWSFNEESVARAVFASAIPVISAVGHEQDVVISDMAADLRAATPTAAAELAVPDVNVLRDRLERCSPERLAVYLKDRYENSKLRCENAMEQCRFAINGKLAELSHRLAMLKLEIESTSPHKLLERGYAMVKRGDVWIGSSAVLKTGEDLIIHFADGTAAVTVNSVEVGDGKDN